MEKHFGEKDPGQTGGNIMNPKTVVYLGENSTMQMETIQIRGIDSTKRETDFFCEAGSEVVVTERLLTHGAQEAESDMRIELNGHDARGRVISRSVAQDRSHQIFQCNKCHNFIGLGIFDRLIGDHAADDLFCTVMYLCPSRLIIYLEI